VSGAEPVAVVGMAGLFPGAPDTGSFWENIVTGHDAISEVPPQRWDPEYYDPGRAGAERFYCRRGGFVDDIATFDPARFGIMPVAVDHADPDQFVALGVAAAALEDAGGVESPRVDPRRVGVILGRGGYYNAGIVRLDQRVRVAEQICLTLREVLPDLPDDRIDEVRAAFRQPDRQPPGPARPGLHRRRRLCQLPGGGRPGRPRAAVRTLRPGPGRRQPPLPRRHLLERVHAARSAQPQRGDAAVRPSG